jgi:hypothetical protein
VDRESGERMKQNDNIVDCRLLADDYPSNFLSTLVLVIRLVVLLVFALAAIAQQTPPQHPAQPTNPAPPAAQDQKVTPERRISPEEAKQLLGAVDDILKFDSRDTGLPIKTEVKRQLIDRDKVQAYIEKQLREDEDAQRLKNGEVVLKKMGLVPRDFEVETFLVQLMREQVAGYYDPQTKFVNLLDWLPPETQMPVLAHELTHALQDQNFGMEKWVKGPNHKKKMSPAETIADDESTVARHAILEGQAMAVMIDWMLAPVGKSLADSPQIADAMEAGMAQGGDSPVFNKSPLYLQRVLIFPYTYGLDFERALLKLGKDKAYASLFKRPPQSTREVMEPAAYLADEKLPPLNPPELAGVLGKDWEMYDVGSIGEFDVAMIAEQFANAAISKTIYPAWRGGYYYALRKKGAQVKEPGDIGLVFVTKWAEPAAQSTFAKLYTASLQKRYTDVQPVVAGASSDSTDPGSPTHWKTSEGDAFVESHGDLLIMLESIDEANAAKLRSVLVPKSQ